MPSERSLQAWLVQEWKRHEWEDGAQESFVVRLPHKTKVLGEPSVKIIINGEWWHFETKLVWQRFKRGGVEYYTDPKLELSQYAWHRKRIESGEGRSVVLLGQPETGNNWAFDKVFIVPPQMFPLWPEWWRKVRVVHGRYDIERAIADPDFWREQRS
jgi:hypothetical protein